VQRGGGVESGGGEGRGGGVGGDEGCGVMISSRSRMDHGVATCNRSAQPSDIYPNNTSFVSHCKPTLSRSSLA
jgi:hypothetical protein